MGEGEARMAREPSLKGGGRKGEGLGLVLGPLLLKKGGAYSAAKTQIGSSSSVNKLIKRPQA